MQLATASYIKKRIPSNKYNKRYHVFSEPFGVFRLCCVAIGVVTISDKLDSLEAPDALDKPLQAFSGNGVVAVDTLR